MMIFDDVWSVVQAAANRPLAAPAITVLAFVAAQRAQSRWPNNPLMNPTLCAIVLVIIFIGFGDVSYASYTTNTQVINFMLGPAIVLLAVPLYRHLPLIRASWPLVTAALVVGLPVGILSSLAIGLVFGANLQTLYALAPKSVTAGIAMGIEEILGGIPALTAVFVISTGIIGAAFGPWILRMIRIRDHRVLGLAIGMGGHGIATARAFQLSEKAGAFASLAMALNGIVTAIVIPVGASVMHLHFKADSGLELQRAPPASIEPMTVQIGHGGFELWMFLITHQAELLVSMTILLAIASFTALYLVAGAIKGGHLVEKRRRQAEWAANDTIEALERLVGRQALELERVRSWSPQMAMADGEIRSNGKAVPLRRVGA